MDNNFMKSILYRLPIAIIMAIIVISAYGCGPNPPFAPFGSEITIVDPPGDITIPPEAISDVRVQALVTGPEGDPLNGVIVVWDLSFAGVNDIVTDTNGDGVADARALQLVDNDACPGITGCLGTPVSQWFALGAFVDSPFVTTADDRGVADVVILINGFVVVDPATLEASLENGSVDVIEFTVNVP
jgi:hypothetical protein